MYGLSTPCWQRSGLILGVTVNTRLIFYFFVKEDVSGVGNCRDKRCCKKLHRNSLSESKYFFTVLEIAVVVLLT